MFEPNRCPGCGAALPSDAPAGLCPLCLLRHGLGCEEPEPSCEGDFQGGAADAAVSLDSAQERVQLPRVSFDDAEPGEVSGPALGCDRYQILGEIARGGMGAILKGRDPALGRDLAIKVLLDQHRAHPEFVRRFVEEARIGGQLQHPGIVPVYELGRFRDLLPYFAMKLIDGRTLADLLATRDDPSRDLARFLDIFEQVGQTMAYAHARGVIHRDLKPANIMVGAFGEVQVMDWGLAKVLARVGPADQESARLDRRMEIARNGRDGSAPGGSHAGSVLGTPAYMAPEQARGELDLVDERADVFGLGAILCELLTGRPPYRGTDAGGGDVRDRAARADLGEALARIDACGAEPELIALARNCLAPLPAGRPRDAGEVAHALTAHRRGMLERLRRAELSSVVARAKADGEKKRRRLTVGLAAAIVGFLAAIGGGGSWLILERQARASRVDMLVREAEMLKTQAEAAVDDPLKWATAREAARHAMQLLGDARDPSAHRRITALAAEVEAEAAASEADAKLLDQLAETREAMYEVSPAHSDAAFAGAFRPTGLDLENRPPEETAQAIARRPAGVARGITMALDSWAGLRRDRGDCDGAARLITVTRAADPDPWRGRLRLALAECDDRARAAALRDLARSAPDADLSPISFVLLGSALLRASDPVTAEAVLRAAQRRHPADVWLALLLGQSLERLARRPEAIRYYMTARALRPQSAHPLAHALDLQGEADEAIAVFRELIRLSPTNARHRFCFGKLLRARGHAGEADEAFDSAIRLGREAIGRRPDDPLLHNLMGMALGERGRLDEAVARYEEAIRIEPADASAHSNLGRALYERGRADDAIAELREAIRLQPHDHATHISLAAALDNRGRADEAVIELREAIRLQPDHHVAHLNLGRVLLRQGHADDALAEYREASRLEPADAKIHEAIGFTLIGLARYGQAIVELREAIRLKPDLASAHYNLAIALCFEGRKGEASAEYRVTLDLAPDFAEAHCNLASLLRDQGRYAESLAEYERGHELGSRRANWPYPSDRWVGQLRRLVRLEHARRDPEFAGVEEPDAMIGLSESERAEWRALRAEVDAALARSQAASPGERPGSRAAPP